MTRGVLCCDDGQVMHCYHPKRALVDEVKVEADAAPLEPTTLAQLGRDKLPAVDVSIARLLDMAETAFPKNYKVRCHPNTPLPAPLVYNKRVVRTAFVLSAGGGGVDHGQGVS